MSHLFDPPFSKQDIFYAQMLNWTWYISIVVRKYNDDVIKWKHFPRDWPFVRGIHRSPVKSLHNAQWCGALVFSLICAWINACVHSREAGDLRRHRVNYDVNVTDERPQRNGCHSPEVAEREYISHLGNSACLFIIKVWRNRRETRNLIIDLVSNSAAWCAKNTEY